MAAGSVTVYSPAALALGTAGFNLSSDTIVCLLLGSGYTPDATAHSTFANVSAQEVTGTGYTAGGLALTSQSWTTSGGVATFTAANVTWANSTITARYAVLVRRAGASLVSGDRLLAYVDLTGGGTISSTSAAFTIQWNASGIFTMTHTP
jgi:hypothetical protein